MSTAAKTRQRWLTGIIGGLSLLLGASARAADQPAERIALPKESALPGRALTLAECLQLAQEKQPAIAAHQASLAAAHTGKKALDNLGAVSVVLSPDIPFRRKQSCIGVEIAEAGLRLAESETAYNVTRMYFTVLYARDQQRLANEVVDNFQGIHDLVADQVKSGKSRDWTTSTVNKLGVYLRLAQARRAEARHGIERASAALREAIGLGFACPLVLADEGLPAAPPVALKLDELVATALAQRGEVTQSVLAVDLFNLEVDAQGRSCLPGKIATFAAGGDIHAKPVPANRSNGDYHPGAVGLEMPTLLVGRRCDRMQRARDFAHRAQAVADKTRNLVTLEVEDYYHRFREAETRLQKTSEAAKAGAELAEASRNAVSGGKVKIEDLLADQVLGAQSRSQYNEALWNYLLTLAGLERVTGGGFCPGFGK